MCRIGSFASFTGCVGSVEFQTGFQDAECKATLLMLIPDLPM
jgi:hypothetical protein